MLDACPDRFVGKRVALLDAGADHVCVMLSPISVAHAVLPCRNVLHAGTSAAGEVHSNRVLPPGAGEDTRPEDWLMLQEVLDLHAGHDAAERQRPR